MRPVDRLTHNLLTHFSRHALAESRFRAFGLKRIVRDLLHYSRRTPFEGRKSEKGRVANSKPKFARPDYLLGKVHFWRVEIAALCT